MPQLTKFNTITTTFEAVALNSDNCVKLDPVTGALSYVGNFCIGTYKVSFQTGNSSNALVVSATNTSFEFSVNISIDCTTFLVLPTVASFSQSYNLASEATDVLVTAPSPKSLSPLCTVQGYNILQNNVTYSGTCIKIMTGLRLNQVFCNETNFTIRVNGINDRG